MAEYHSSKHYSLAHQPLELNAWAQQTATKLKKKLGKYHPIFIYRGMSGIATFTALSIAYATKFGSDSFSAMYVRKPNEDAHGLDVEYDINVQASDPSIFVFVDDFICGGSTRSACLYGAVKAKIKWSPGRVLEDFNIHRSLFIQALSGDCEKHSKSDAGERVEVKAFRSCGIDLWPDSKISIRDKNWDDYTRKEWAIVREALALIKPKYVVSAESTKIQKNSMYGPYNKAFTSPKSVDNTRPIMKNQQLTPRIEFGIVFNFETEYQLQG